MMNESDAPLRERTRRDIETQNPPLTVGDFWSIYANESGKCMRTVRIVGEYPFSDDLDWTRKEGDKIVIVQEISKTGVLELRLVPEFNLRYAYKRDNNE